MNTIKDLLSYCFTARAESPPRERNPLALRIEQERAKHKIRRQQERKVERFVLRYRLKQLQGKK